jgi:predicted amidohydrolase
MARSTLRIAFLHLAPVSGELPGNRQRFEQAVRQAACQGAQWILTPELSVCGYSFADTLGTDWIEPQPDPWMSALCRLSARLGTTIFLSHPERDPSSGSLHNSLFALAEDGRVVGPHRKINALRVGSESWSSPGDGTEPVSLSPVGLVGLLICADACSPGIAKTLKAHGARMLVSSAAWAPGFHGPNGEWERCTVDTGLPLLVCNRTGEDRTMNFTRAESVVVQDGRRLLSMTSERPALFLIDWGLPGNTLGSPHYQCHLL